MRNEACGKVPKRVCRVEVGESASAWLLSRLRWIIVGAEEAVNVGGAERKGETIPAGVRVGSAVAIACGLDSGVLVSVEALSRRREKFDWLGSVANRMTTVADRATSWFFFFFWFLH